MPEGETDRALGCKEAAAARLGPTDENDRGEGEDEQASGREVALQQAGT